jgi:tetratricopeptide (TPR) repeat protein
MAIFNRATLLDETGDYRGAIRDYTTVISEYPKFLLGYQKRAAARRKIGDMKGALSDEEHVLKEQIAHQYGYATTTSQQKNKVRKKSKVNLDEYRSPIIEDEESTQPAYKNEYRGKVQNVKASLHPQTVYTLTYYENPNKIQVNNTYNNEIESVNSSKILPHKLLMNNHAINLNDQKFSEHINHIAYLQSKTTITSAEAFAIAIEYMLVNEFERAIEMFDTSITDGTNASLSHFGKGTAHYKHAEAYAYIAAPDNKKSATSSNSIKAYHYREAVKHFDKAISLNPDFAEAHYNKGVAEMALSDFDTAIKDFDTAITLNPDLAEAHYNKGIILIQQGKTDEAITALSRAGELGLYTAYSIIKKHQKQNQ